MIPRGHELAGPPSNNISALYVYNKHASGKSGRFYRHLRSKSYNRYCRLDSSLQACTVRDTLSLGSICNSVNFIPYLLFHFNFLFGDALIVSSVSSQIFRCLGKLRRPCTSCTPLLPSRAFLLAYLRSASNVLPF